MVLVVGSANVDVSVNVADLPQAGETVIGREYLLSVGGKGANQAIASACGATTHFLGRIGADDFGQKIMSTLASRGVHTEAMRTLDGVSTGVATICVNERGQNCIVVVPGANHCLRPDDLNDEALLIRSASAIAVQCEIPLDTVYSLIDMASETAACVILNPAPYLALDFERLSRKVTYFVPNQSEASRFMEQELETLDQVRAAASWLVSKGFENVIITLGEKGCMCADSRSTHYYPAIPVCVIDTTGAGDAFVGCLAASLANGRSRHDAIRRAMLYAGLTTQRRGAQASYPSAEEFELE